MSVQPPGYNPDDSLLQGGTANITPLMGGGGFIEGNPNESMLDGGNSANIVPLKGGRRTKRKKSLRRASRRKSKRKSRTHRGGEPPSMQTYKDTLDKTFELKRETMESLQPGESSFLNVLGKVADTVQTDVPSVTPPTESEKRKQISDSILQAQRAAVEAEGKRQEEEAQKAIQASTVLQPMTVDNSAVKAYEDMMKSLDNTVLKGGGSLTTGTFNSTTNTLPNLSGQLDTYRKDYRAYMNRMPWYRTRKDSQREYSAKLNRNQVCAIQRDLPGDLPVQTADRLAIFLPNTVDTIYVFQPVNGDPTILQSSIDIIQKTKGDTIFLFSPPFFNPAGDNKNILANFLDLKLKHPEKIFMLTEHTNNNIKVGCAITEENESLIHMYEPTYVIYPYKCNIEENSDNKMGVVFSAGAKNEPLCPKSKNSNYYSIGEYLTIGNRGDWLVFPPNNEEDFYISNNYYTYKFLNDGKDIKEDYKIFNLKNDDDAQNPEMLLNYNKFQESSKASENDILPTKVVADGTIFFLRTPKDIIVNKAVQPYMDWLQGIFVKSEADYLNALNLRPDMLESIFGNRWKAELADFLHYLTTTKCFDDVRALSKADCNRTSDFVEKVYEYFLLHDERIRSMDDDETEFALQAAKDFAERARRTELDTGKSLAQMEEKFKAQLDALWAQASSWGIDPSRDPRDYNKDPYKDGVVKLSGNNNFTDNPLQDVNNLSQWNMTIMLVHKPNKNTSFAKIYIDKLSNENVADAKTLDRFNTKCEQLNKEYPSWFFIMPAS